MPVAHPVPPADAILPETSIAVAEPAPPILIQLDPDIGAGFIHGRFDVQLRGRVASPAAIEELEVESGGVVVARAVFGQPTRAPVVVMPDGTPGRQRAFQLTLPRPQNQASAPCLCLLRARTSDGHSHSEQLDLAIDPTAPSPVMVRTGPVLVGVAQTGGRPQILLYVERAVLDSDGNLSVHGWTLAMTQIVTVQVFAGDQERLPAAQLGLPRDDVAAVYPIYPNGRQSGFSCSGHIDSPAWSLDQRPGAGDQRAWLLYRSHCAVGACRGASGCSPGCAAGRAMAGPGATLRGVSPAADLSDHRGFPYRPRSITAADTAAAGGCAGTAGRVRRSAGQPGPAAGRRPGAGGGGATAGAGQAARYPLLL